MTRETILRIFIAVSLMSFAGSAGRQATRPGVKIDALKIAEGVAATMKDRVYGNEEKNPKTINCVEYLIKVVEECCAQSKQDVKFTAELRRRIAIDDIKPDENLNALVEKGDDRIKGVQWALVQAGLGEAVSLADVKPGDFVQYWYRHESAGGTQDWAGHSAVIKSITNGQAILLGAHKTVLSREQDKPEKERKGGVGESVPINLGDATRKAFVVRWKT